MKAPMSEKSPEVKALVEKMFPGTGKAIAEGRCPMCGQEITEFRNALSQREYEISGMCQHCQDSVFGED